MSAREAVRALLAGKIDDLGYTALEYRDEDDAITEAALPCVLIQQAGPIEVTMREGHSGGTFEHSAAFFLSFAAQTRADAEAMLVATAGALATDYNLGGQVQEVVPVSWGDEDDEGRDIAAIVLEIRITFCTSHDDWGTLI